MLLNRELERLRGLAAIMVLCGHFFFSFRTLVPSYLGYTEVAVEIFFVLSGFLIVSQLLQNFNLRAYFTRRIFRVMPLLFFWLPIYWLTGFCSGHDLLFPLTFTANFEPLRDFNYPLGYLWSLSIDEQFYVLLPVCYFLLAKPRYLLYLQFFIITAMTIAKVPWLVQLILDGLSSPSQHYIFHLRYEGICCGVILACLNKIDRLPKVKRNWLTHFFGWSVLLPWIISILLSGQWTEAMLHVLRIYLILPCATLAVWAAQGQVGAVTAPRWIERIFEYAGSRSYGLYMSHLMIIYWSFHPPWHLWGIGYRQLAFAIPMTFLCTELVYRFYESPMRQLGYRLTPRRPKLAPLSVDANTGVRPVLSNL